MNASYVVKLNNRVHVLTIQCSTAAVQASTPCEGGLLYAGAGRTQMKRVKVSQ
jgi:hypothetical protein